MLKVNSVTPMVMELLQYAEAHAETLLRAIWSHYLSQSAQFSNTSSGIAQQHEMACVEAKVSTLTYC